MCISGRYFGTFWFLQQYYITSNVAYIDPIYLFFKNVDAGAAKELMAHLVKLQSSLGEVNKYDSLAIFI